MIEEELRQYFLYLKNVKNNYRTPDHRHFAVSASSTNKLSTTNGTSRHRPPAPEKKLPVIVSPTEMADSLAHQTAAL